jgi:hypothetical protein
VSIALELLRQNAILIAVGMFASEANDEKFIKIVDDLVVSSENDPDLAEGLKWIDMQSRKNGVTFYEMALVILKKHMAERRAKEWMKAKMAA